MSEQLTETPEGAVREIEAGDMLGRYELLVPIAKGGMGRVWAARLRGVHGFKKLVAVKTMIPSMSDPRSEQMMLQEANIASQIRHPNVVQTHELGEQDGVVYLVMELILGEPLSAVLREAVPSGGLPLDLAVNIIGQILRGLHAAHELRGPDGEETGLIHRDVSPQNVIVSYLGEVKILDFGIAKFSGETGLTYTGEIKGKVSYLAPEQLRSEPMDRRVDVFAVGILMYMALLGRHPFRGANDSETLANIYGPKSATPPSTFVEDFPDSIEEVLMRALAKSRDDRWATAQEMGEALEKARPGAFEPRVVRELQEHLIQRLGDSIAKRRELIRKAEEAAEATPSRSAASESPASTATEKPVTKEAEPPQKPRTRRRTLARAAVVVAVMSAVYAVAAVRKERPPIPAEARPHAAATSMPVLPPEPEAPIPTASASAAPEPAVPAPAVAKAVSPRPAPRVRKKVRKEVRKAVGIEDVGSGLGRPTPEARPEGARKQVLFPPQEK